MMAFNESFVGMLKREMWDRELTMVEMADFLELKNVSTLSIWLRGGPRFEGKLSVLIDVCERLGYRLDIKIVDPKPSYTSGRVDGQAV